MQTDHFWRTLGHGYIGVKTQTRRRNVIEIVFHPVNARHFKAVHALAQHRLQRIFPAGFDVQFLPNALTRRELVFFQPFAELSLGLDFFLQLRERVQTRGQLRNARLLVQGTAARLIERVLRLRQLCIHLVQRGLRGFLARQFIGQLHVKLVVLFRILRARGDFFLLQALTAQYQIGQLPVSIALIVGGASDRLLGLRQLRARVLHFLHGFAVARFQIGQVFMGDGKLFTQHCLVFQRLFALGGEVVHVVEQLRLPCLPLRHLLFDLLNLRFNSRTSFGHEAQFGLDTRDFGVGRVHGRLRAVQIIGQLVMLHAPRFQLCLCMTQFGNLRFQIILRLLDFRADFVALRLGFVVAQNPQIMQFVLRGIL